MALSEKSRNEMFSYFSSTPLGEEVTSEMIASFPGDDFVTKDFLRAELADQIGSVRTDMAEQTQKLLLWMVATMITLAGILSGLIIAVR